MLKPVTRHIDKFVGLMRRDGVRLALRKAAGKLWAAFINTASMRKLKQLCPPGVKAGVKEWLRSKSEPVLPQVDPVPPAPGEPLAAVIIPCYNYGKYLPEAVSSALNQTLRNIEIIVVDDGSGDPYTITVLKEMEKKDGVTVIRQPNKGLPAARNTGIRATRARYITCLDADDLIDPTYLEKTVTVLEARPDVGLAYSYAELFGDVNEIWYTETMDPGKLLKYNHVPVVAVFRRQAWEEVGGYDESMRAGYEDWDFWLRLAGAGYKGYLVREPLFKHRRHGKTMTHRAREKHARLVKEIRQKHSGVKRVRMLPAKEVKPEKAFVNMDGQVPVPGEKRLLLIVPWLEVGGAESVLAHVVKAFVETGSWRVYIATTVEATNEWGGRFRQLTPYIYLLPELLPRRYFNSYIKAFCTRNRINAVLISHSEIAYLSLKSLRENLPDILILDLLHNHGSEGYAEMGAAMDAYLDGHIVVHRGIERVLTAKYGVAADKVITIPNGVDRQRFKPATSGREKIKKELGLDPERRQVIFLGRLSVEKNPYMFVEAAARLRDLPRVEWLCYGDGPLKKNVQSAAAKLESPVKFMGNCTDSAALLKAVDLLVLTSHSEGLPMVILEALMSGVPVVATRVGGVPEIIKPGFNGFLVEPGNLESLCSVLRDILSGSKIEEMKKKCRSSVLKNYSGAQMAGSYVRLYERLLREK